MIKGKGVRRVCAGGRRRRGLPSPLGRANGEGPGHRGEGVKASSLERSARWFAEVYPPPGSERTLLQRAVRHEQNSGLSPSCCKAREKRLSRDYLHGMAHDLKWTAQITLGVDLCAWMSRCIRKCHVSNKIHLLFRIRWFQNAFLCSHRKNTSAQVKNTPGSFLSQNKKRKQIVMALFWKPKFLTGLFFCAKLSRFWRKLEGLK